MKKQVSMIIATLGFLVAIMTSAVSVNAQSGRIIGRADIPFDFTINNRTLSAGQYIIETVSSDGIDLLRVRSATNAASVMFLTHSVRANAPLDSGKLVFHRYGNQYFLSQIWQSVDRLVGSQVIECRMERTLRRERQTSDRLAQISERQTLHIAMR